MGSIKHMNSKPRDIENQKGISLIESMIALLIFMFGVLGWLSLEMAISEESLQGQARAQATFITNSTADFLKQIPYLDLQTSDSSLFFNKEGLETDIGADDAIFTISWTVTELPVGTPEYKAVAIRADWRTTKGGVVMSSLDLNFERAP